MRDAFNLLMRNIASVYVTSRVTSLQFFVFNVAISSAMGGLTYLFLPQHDMQSNLMIYPILISVIGSFMVATTFFGVYSMAIDTLFLCFCKCITLNMMMIMTIKSWNTIRLNDFFCYIFFFFHFSGRLRTKWWNRGETILHVTAIDESTSQKWRKSSTTTIWTIIIILIDSVIDRSIFHLHSYTKCIPILFFVNRFSNLHLE